MNLISGIGVLEDFKDFSCLFKLLMEKSLYLVLRSLL